MIILKLMGGLGNQMFQYSFGRALSLNLGQELYFDTSYFQSDISRNFDLYCYNINNSFIDPKEINKKEILHLNERFFHFDDNVFKTKYDKDIYVNGYWQSEKYFKFIEPYIRKDFQLKMPLTGEEAGNLSLIETTNSVSLHIRRGDFLVYPYNKVHYVCPTEYYFVAMKYIKSKVRNPVFYIFSDDIEWAKENIKDDSKVVYISKSGKKDAKNNLIDRKAYIDMYLMSKCKHNIMANSTFSWWSTWLNNNNHKIVICPKKWFMDNERDTKDLYSENWIKI